MKIILQICTFFIAASILASFIEAGGDLKGFGITVIGAIIVSGIIVYFYNRPKKWVPKGACF